jgi:hypothetical protein
MKHFADYFSEESIIDELCEQRINRSIPLHRRAFYNRISNDNQDRNYEEMNQNDDLNGLFPPRKIWPDYRPLKNQRNVMSKRKINLATLITVVRKLMVEDPYQPWVNRLRERASLIRFRALEGKDFIFRHQSIVGQKKKPGSSEYRPITKYPTNDNIIQKLTLRYLSDRLDSFFSDSSHAYRKFRNKSETQINRDSALRHIAAFRKAHGTLYVAEADIRNFMDCVDHATASQALRSLIMQAKMRDPGIDVDPRAIQLYDAFLAGYSFRRDVLGKATEELNKKNRKGYFAWPSEELAGMHGDDEIDEIGIPQGGALSCFVVNVMLHEVDQAVENIDIPDGQKLQYNRFCDDMLILSSDKELCNNAMDAYLRAIKLKKLLVHEPVDVYLPDVGLDTTHVLDLKSKKPYLWARQEDGGIPWIQFLGYLIQYDGQFQIRPKSIDKQIQKMNEEARKLCERINPKAKDLNQNPAGFILKMKPHKILIRFYKKLVSMSVGRRNNRQPLPACKEDIKPMCWANGYKYLWEVPYDPCQLRALDRHRERVMMQIYRRLEPFMLSKNDRADADRVMQEIRKHGFRYSYYGQFAKKAETDRSRSLSNTTIRENPKARFRHVVSSIFRWLRRW